MLLNLLETAASVASDAAGSAGKKFPWGWVIIGLILVLMIVTNSMNNKKRRAQMEAEKEKRNAIQPGFKVTTIGGIVGVVVEVDEEANTFVLQTGSNEFPSYLKFDKVAIYASEDPNAPVDEPEEVFEEENADVNEETAETPVDETVEEVVDETVVEVVDETAKED